MNFAEYFDIITKSVCETGYDAFLPSLCAVDGDNVVMKVLDGEVSTDGDEKLATNWAKSLAHHGRTVFFAYRQGHRTVIVVELRGFDTFCKRRIRVDPFVPEELDEATRKAP